MSLVPTGAELAAASADHLGTHSLGTHSLGSHSLEAHSLGTHSLGSHSLGSHSLGTHSLEAHSLEAHSLEAHSLTAAAPVLPGTSCPVFPTNNVWNAPIAKLPVDPRSATYIAAIGQGSPLHADFGSGTWDGGPIGIPYNVVGASQPRVPVSFMYASESDPGPYPLPAHPLIEGGAASTGDRHVLVVSSATCTDYELWDAYPGSPRWKAGSGAVFALRSNKLRPAGWTSADAAGLPILPGLVLAQEVRSGHLDHAIRITVPCTARRYIWPARHEAGSEDPSCPPMGLRLRLKASFNVSGFPRVDQVILADLKTYGAIVADNGSPWYLSGAPSPWWDNDALHQLDRVTGRDFEAVDESSLELYPGTAAAH